MSTLNYTSINTIIARMNLGNSMFINNGDIIEYAGQALDRILINPLLDNSVVFVPIVNHKGKIPTGTIDINQIGKYNYTGDLKTLLNPRAVEAANVCPKTIYNEVIKVIPTASCSCTKYNKEDVLNVNSFVPFFEVGGVLYEAWAASQYCQSNFTPMYLTSNTMFNALECVNQMDIVVSHREEYNIKYPHVITSFPEGIIAMSILRHKIDENGFPMLPADEYVEAAIEYYIKWKYFENEFNNKGSNINLRNLEYNKIQYEEHATYAISRAKTKLRISQMENFTAMNKSLLPNDFTYQNFFNDLHLNYG